MSDKTYDHTKIQGTGGRDAVDHPTRWAESKKCACDRDGRDKHRKEQGRSSYEKSQAFV